MRKSSIKLPSLRPATPGTARRKKERNVFGLTSTNSKPSSEYEVNRTIFQDMKPTDPSEIKKKKRAKPKALDPIESSKNEKQEETKKEEEPSKPSEISQIEALMNRIPNADKSVSSDIVYKITPVLDRVLCIVSSFQCIEYIDDPVIAELFKRLFALIEVDDFLTRIIICRILLLFVKDETSPLILPISKIFYKLSCDPSNDDYFVEENLDTVLVSILRMKNIEASLMAAGSIRNLAAFEPMREKFCEKDDLFNFIFDTFHDKENIFSKNEEMKAQLIAIVRKMSKSQNFKTKVLESNFLSLAFSNADEKNGNVIITEVLKTIISIGELTDEGKHDFIEWFSERDLFDNLVLIVKCLPIITKDLEKTDICGKLVMSVIQNLEIKEELLSSVLEVMNKCCENENNLKLCQENSKYFSTIVQSPELDTNVRIEAYKIFKRFQGDSFKEVQNEFLFLNAFEAH